jgi:hypothetical protein
VNLGKQGAMAVLQTNIAAKAWEGIPAADKSFKCALNCLSRQVYCQQVVMRFHQSR